MEKSEQINELAQALSKAQGEMKPAKKASNNPFFKSNYAALDDCWDAIREPLSKNGLSVMQITEEKNGHLILVTLLAHISGQWIKGEFPIMSKDNTPQSLGSAMSYAKRYGLCAIVGIVASDEDDDAEGAEGRYPQQAPKEYAKPSQGSQAPRVASPAQVKYMSDLLSKVDPAKRAHIVDKYEISDVNKVSVEDANNIIKELQ